jgi:hypothetical protein
MSYKFISKSGKGSTSIADIYSNSADAAIVFSLSLTNNRANPITVSLKLFSESTGLTSNIIGVDTSLDVGETINPIGGVQKIALNNKDKIQIICSEYEGVDYVLSSIEFSDYIW